MQVAVALMIGGKDGSLQPTNIVLSALSITFVLQIDNVVGRFVLQIWNWQDEDLLKKFKYDYTRTFQTRFGDVVNAVVTILCFVFFLYQIITANDFESFSFAPFRMSNNPYEHVGEDKSCYDTVWALFFNGVLFTSTVLVFEVLGALIELGPVSKRFYWEIGRAHV